MHRDVLGVLEFIDTATGHLALDALVKSAPVEVIACLTINPGKLLVVVSGDVASVETAVNRGRTAGGGDVLDSLFLPYVHPLVAAAFDPAEDPPGEIDGEASIAVVEASTVTAGVRAADAAAKTSAVHAVRLRFDDAMGGRAAIRFLGDLVAVETAVDTAVEKLRAEGHLVRATVIPNPHPDMLAALDDKGSAR